MIRQLMIGLLGFGLIGCSAIELNEQNAQATQQREDNIARTVESQVQTTALAEASTLDAIYAEVTESVNELATQSADRIQQADQLATDSAQATTDTDAIVTRIAQTVIANLTPTTGDAESTAEVTPDIEPINLPTTADIILYGNVPIDQDSLNSITGLAFDDDGHLLVSLRAGDIYRLIDEDNDGIADATDRIFADNDDQLGQISGLFMQSGVLYVLNGDQLSQLQDDDDDGVYDTVVQLTDDLPDNQALLQANNSLVRSPDGRTFTADVNTGEILQIIFQE